MKIVEDTPQRLVLKEGAFKGRAVGLIFVVIGLGFVGLGVANHTQHNIFWFYIFGVIFAAAGAFAFLTTKSDLLVADQTSRQLSVTFKSLRKRQGVDQTYSFDDVQAIQLFQNYQQTFNGGPTTFNNGPGISFGGGFGVGMANTSTMLDQTLVVQLKNGQSVTIAHEDKQTGLTLGITANSLITKGQKLATILGVPFNQGGANTPGQMLRGVEQNIAGQPESFVQQNDLPPQQPRHQSNHRNRPKAGKTHKSKYYFFRSTT
jgi:hypothetical protein